MSGMGSSSGSSVPTDLGVPGLNGDVFTIAGPFLYGGLGSAALVGCLIIQTIFYFARASGDRWQYKIAVVALMGSSLAVMGATIYLNNFVFLQNFGNPQALHAWSVAVFVPLACPTFSAVVSQALYGYRLFSLAKKNKWVGGALLILLLINAASGLTAIVVEAQGGGPVPLNANDLLLFIPIVGARARTSFWRTIVVNEIFLAITAATDVLLTCCLTVLLLTRRKKSSELSRDTNHLIWRVVSLSITTGAVTSAYSIGVAVLVLATIHNNNIAMAFILPLTHVYGLVCLSSLNLRRSMTPGYKGGSSTGSNHNVSRSLGAVPSVDKLRMRIDLPSPDEKRPYGFPPQRSLSQSSQDPSRPGTGKTLYEYSRPGTGTNRSFEPTRSLSNRIQVHSSVEQHVEAVSPGSPEMQGAPVLSYFAPRSTRSQSQRSGIPDFGDPEKGWQRPAQVQAHNRFPSSTSPSDAHPRRKEGFF